MWISKAHSGTQKHGAREMSTELTMVVSAAGVLNTDKTFKKYDHLSLSAANISNTRISVALAIVPMI